MTCLIYLFKWFSLCKCQLDCKHTKCFERRSGSLTATARQISFLFHLFPSSLIKSSSSSCSSYREHLQQTDQLLRSKVVFPRSQLPSPATRVWEMRCVAALLHGSACFLRCLPICGKGCGCCTTFTIHNCMHALARRVLVIGQEDLHRHWWVQQKYTRHSFLSSLGKTCILV